MKDEFGFENVLMKIWMGIMFMVLLPMIAAFAIVMLLTDNLAKKCKYHKVCEYYSNQSETCTKNAGEYQVGMFEAKPASCYLRMNDLHEIRY